MAQNHLNYTIDVIVNNNTLNNSTFQLNIIECQTGDGLSTSSIFGDSLSVCETCEYNSFSLESNLQECLICEDNNGYTCSGTNQIYIEQDYWIGIYNYTNTNYLFDNDILKTS